MYMEATVTVCDGYQKQLPSPEKGAVMLKDNGSGCWEIVSYVCGDYVETHGIKPLTKEKCRMMIESKGGFLSV